MSTITWKIGDISDQIRGVTYRKQDAVKTKIEGFVPILRAGNITDEGLAYEDLVYVPAARVSAKQKVRKNDILIAASSGSLDVVGKAAQALEDFEGGFGAFCKVLRPNKEVDAAYFAQYFKTPYYRRRVSFLAAGANINNLRNEDLDGLEIPLPPLEEQRRIAKILDAADALRAKRGESLVLLDSLIQSTFLDMFGDPVSNPMGWEVIRITDIVEGKYGIKAGPFGSTLKKEDYVSSGYRVYGQEQVIAGRFDIGDYYVDEAKFNNLKNCAVKAGDVLVSLVGSYGKVLIVPEGIKPGIINPRLLKITPCQELVLSLYLAILIQSDEIQRKLKAMSHGGTMGILNAGLLKQLVVPLPPLPLQQRFASIVESIEKQKTRLKAHLSELDNLFASLQSRAFQGEL